MWWSQDGKRMDYLRMTLPQLSISWFGGFRLILRWLSRRSSHWDFGPSLAKAHHRGTAPLRKGLQLPGTLNFSGIWFQTLGFLAEKPDNQPGWSWRSEGLPAEWSKISLSWNSVLKKYKKASSLVGTLKCLAGTPKFRHFKRTMALRIWPHMISHPHGLDMVIFYSFLFYVMLIVYHIIWYVHVYMYKSSKYENTWK